MNAPAQSGLLYVVATPIGNLEDITLRALRILGEVSVILAEDTRHSRILCERHGIKTPLRAYHAHSSDGTTENIVAELRAGAKMALVSDAGTPLISDPGAQLVAACIEAGVRVEPIPGASAVVAAVSVSGLKSDAFRFVGFLARSGATRREELEAIARDATTTVVYESPQRLHDTLVDLSRTLDPDRRIAVCRELTKAHEEVVRGTALELAAHFEGGARGEIVIVIEGHNGKAPTTASESASPAQIEARIRDLYAGGMSKRDIAKTLTNEFGMKKSDAYARVLATV